MSRKVSKLPKSIKLKIKTQDGSDVEGSGDEESNPLLEEHLILRMPPGPDAIKLKKMVESREISENVWFKFKDSRRAIFCIDGHMYKAKLVDLPTITESHKLLDNKQMFKVADICQMILVEGRIENEEEVVAQGVVKNEEFIYPHGITPPLKYVRKRRFRKRVSKRTIEAVETEVERLLQDDALAEDISFEVVEGGEEESDVDLMSEKGEGVGDIEGVDIDGEQEGEEDIDGDADSDLAAEINKGLEELDEVEEEEEEEEEESEASDSDGEEEEEDDEDDEDMDDEARENAQQLKLLRDEISELESTIQKRQTDLNAAANPIIQRRIADMIRKTKAQLELKKGQLDERLREEETPTGEKEEEEKLDKDQDTNPMEVDAS